MSFCLTEVLHVEQVFARDLYVFIGTDEAMMVFLESTAGMDPTSLAG